MYIQNTLRITRFMMRNDAKRRSWQCQLSCSEMYTGISSAQVAAACCSVLGFPVPKDLALFKTQRHLSPSPLMDSMTSLKLVGDVLEKSGEKHVILLIHLVEWTQNGHVIHSPHHIQDIPTRSGFNHGPRGLICTHVQRGICQWYNLLTWPCLQLVCIEEQ